MIQQVRWQPVAAILGLAFLILLWFVEGVAPLPAVLAALVVGGVFAIRFPYGTFALAAGLVPAIGWFISIPTKTSSLAEYAFGSSIDISVPEIVVFFAFLGWTVRVFFQGIRRKDPHWRIHTPHLLPQLALTGAHFLSAFSSAQPATIPVWKFALRPVAYVYGVFVFLTTNLLRTERRLREVLGTIAVSGGFVAILSLIGSARALLQGAWPEAVPIPLAGIAIFGSNHNATGETMIYTLPLTLAFLRLIRRPISRGIVMSLVGLQVAAGILSFTRSFWLALLIQLVFVAFAIGPALRAKLREWAPWVVLGGIPALIGIVWYSVQIEAIGSLTTRSMLAEISWLLFTQHPWVGVGAGTFLAHIGQTLAFVVDFGTPLDAHGFLWKLLAETGMIGFAAILWYGWDLFRIWTRDLARVVTGSHDIVILLFASAIGSMVYQLLSTSYWTGKLWLPIGLAAAAGWIYRGDGKREG